MTSVPQNFVLRKKGTTKCITRDNQGVALQDCRGSVKTNPNYTVFDNTAAVGTAGTAAPLTFINKNAGAYNRNKNNYTGTSGYEIWIDSNNNIRNYLTSNNDGALDVSTGATANDTFTIDAAGNLVSTTGFSKTNNALTKPLTHLSDAPELADLTATFGDKSQCVTDYKESSWKGLFNTFSNAHMYLKNTLKNVIGADGKVMVNQDIYKYKDDKYVAPLYDIDVARPAYKYFSATPDIYNSNQITMVTPQPTPNKTHKYFHKCKGDPYCYKSCYGRSEAECTAKYPEDMYDPDIGDYSRPAGTVTVNGTTGSLLYQQHDCGYFDRTQFIPDYNCATAVVNNTNLRTKKDLDKYVSFGGDGYQRVVEGILYAAEQNLGQFNSFIYTISLGLERLMHYVLYAYYLDQVVNDVKLHNIASRWNAYQGVIGVYNSGPVGTRADIIFTNLKTKSIDFQNKLSAARTNISKTTKEQAIALLVESIKLRFANANYKDPYGQYQTNVLTDVSSPLDPKLRSSLSDITLYDANIKILLNMDIAVEDRIISRIKGVVYILYNNGYSVNITTPNSDVAQVLTSYIYFLPTLYSYIAGNTRTMITTTKILYSYDELLSRLGKGSTDPYNLFQYAKSYFGAYIPTSL